MGAISDFCAMNLSAKLGHEVITRSLLGILLGMTLAACNE
jgi:hypothetical protein